MAILLAQKSLPLERKRDNRQEDKLLVATGWTKHACADREGRITKIPSTLETILKAKISPLSN